MTRRKPRHKDIPYAPNYMKLLDNVLDALDRMFDSEATAIDVYAIVHATAEAMDDTDLHELLLDTAD